MTIENCELRFTQIWYKVSESANRTLIKGTVKRIDKLKPCTTYEISFVIYNKATNERFWHYEFVNTLDSSPTFYKFEQIMVESPYSLKLAWNTKNGNCVASYKLKLKTFNTFSEESIEISTANSSAQFNDLDACSTYSVALEAISKTENADKPLQIIIKNFSTSVIMPGALEKIKVNVDDSYVDISWLIPKVSGSCVTEYVLMYANKKCLGKSDQSVVIEKSQIGARIPPPDFQTELTEESLTESLSSCWTTRKIHNQQFNLKLENLKKCQHFEFLVYGNGTYPPKIDNLQKLEFKTNSGMIGAVNNLKYFSASSTSGLLSWVGSKDNFECLDHYKIQMNDKAFSAKMSPFTLTGLEACNANYTIKVQPIGIDGLGGNQQSIVLNMNENLMWPTKVSNLTFNQTDYDVTISWLPPDYGAGCNLFYKIKQKQIFPEAESFMETTENVIVLKNWMPCIEYSVEVSAVSIVNKEGPSNVLNVLKSPRGKHFFFVIIRSG